MSITLAPLDQQTIVVTGASSGIGLATARLAAQRGARVVLAARDVEALARISAELNAEGGSTIYVGTDVSDEAQVQRLVEATIERFGGFDTWVNNAGLGLISTADATSTADHHRLFEINYFGLVYGSLAAARHFRETGKPGAIINLGSAVSDMPQMLSVAYSASKHAIKGFTDGLRVELGQEGLPVSVTLIKPSAIDTRFFDHAKTNMGGMGKAPGAQYAPEVVAEAILVAAEHPRRDIAVGQTSALGGRLGALAPRVIEGVQKTWTYDQLIDYEHMPDAESLYEVPREGNERSRYGHGRNFSVTTGLQMHPALSMGAMVIAGAALILAISGSRRR
ncbi:SDR family oxidoreductase [Devosia sediminis]|uniref:SDR family NAD(P)-dependent oxidoreductase n=1 Tax=Devosia sediminis TaxID=2798801 RepID=A0A934IX27_9HYPH|nr:SDR family oxidoreductase [Devosia sediminis]MBJ3784721.1 SDR family NAD(P)-dependent oxidoreductase [Devosia sediminis]